MTTKGRSGTSGVQSVLLPKKLFTPSKAVAWLHKHGYRAEIEDSGKVQSGNYWRARQHDPDPKRGVLERTIPFGASGILAIVEIEPKRAVHAGGGASVRRGGGGGSSDYEKHKYEWSLRDTLLGPGRPPPHMVSLLDNHGGFTAITTKGFRSNSYLRGNSLYRPGALLKRGTSGTLLEFDPHTFYQDNNNTTKALYKAAGYAYPVAVWFDNVTGIRIA